MQICDPGPDDPHPSLLVQEVVCMSSFQKSQELQRQVLGVKAALVMEDQEMPSSLPFASCVPAAIIANVAPTQGSSGIWFGASLCRLSLESVSAGLLTILGSNQHPFINY